MTKPEEKPFSEPFNIQDNVEISNAAQHNPQDGGAHESSFTETDPLMPNPPSNSQAEDVLRILALEDELVKTRDQLIRALAEVENTRKRGLKEREDTGKYAISGFARDLLSVADNLRRAIQSIPPELIEAAPDVKNLMNGIEATERELLRSFEKHNIQKIEPLDQMFDPNFHEAIFEAPMPEKPAGTVLQVVEAGYTLSGRILRPARVGIVKDDGASHPHKIDTQA